MVSLRLQKTYTDNIKKSIESVNWEFLSNDETVNRQVSIFNETIITFFLILCLTSLLHPMTITLLR